MFFYFRIFKVIRESLSTTKYLLGNSLETTAEELEVFGSGRGEHFSKSSGIVFPLPCSNVLGLGLLLNNF